MYNIIFQKEFIRPFTGWCFLLIILIFSAGMLTESRAETLDNRYPGLAAGMLKSAVLEQEAVRHVGFFAQAEVDKQIAAMVLKK